MEANRIFALSLSAEPPMLSAWTADGAAAQKKEADMDLFKDLLENTSREEILSSLVSAVLGGLIGWAMVWIVWGAGL